MNDLKISGQELLSSNSHNRLDALLVLRGFACLMVIINHVQPPRRSIIFNGYDLSWIIFSHANVAVWIFFCLSGYLMGKAFYTERYTSNVTGIKNFWRNRIFRIFPLYYFSTLILALFVTPEVFKIENWGYLIRTLTFTYDFSLPIGVNDAVWSLSTEVQFYLFVPFIYTYLKSRLSNYSQIIFFLFSIIFFAFLLRVLVWMAFYQELHKNSLYAIKYWYVPLSMNLDIFLVGFLVNPWIKATKQVSNEKKRILPAYKKNIFSKSSTKKIIAVGLVLLLYLFTAHHLYHQELAGLARSINGIRTSTTFFILQPLTTLVVSLFIIAFESDKYQEFEQNEKLSFDSILRNPWRSLEIFGILSYGIYIWHQAIIAKIAPIFTSHIPIEAFYARLTATLFFSTLLAAITYYLVESPAAKWKIYR